MLYISKKSSVKGMFEGDSVVLGPSVIGEGSLIGVGVIVGYPSYKKVKELIVKGKAKLESYDEISEGSRIESNCIVRSGSIIYERTVLGKGVQTGHNVMIRENCVVGDGSIVGSHSVLDGNVKVGRNVSIQTGNYLPPGTVVGDGVFLGPFVVITNDRYPASRRLLGVEIEDNAVVGANSTLISGVKIGKNSVVAAGAVVTRDVEPGKVVAGVPARVIMSREEYEEKKGEYERKI
ncbi:MAG: N-acetyltransferase [Thermoproteota archaeon]|nr:MAG: N-acetyltransferase [Candidatus Korarchaeota archaeon]